MNDIAAIIRTKDSAVTLRASLASVRRQNVPVTIIVVDSGSTDDTVPIAEELADHVLHLSSHDFSYGRALNLGADMASSARMHIALSSHCTLPRPDWAALAHRNLGQDSVVATVGASADPYGVTLQTPITANQKFLTDHPWWGMSNHASAWSSMVWRRHPFDEQLSACEDKEWSLRATEDDACIVFDPQLFVSSRHRRMRGSNAYVQRMRREIVATTEFADVPRFTNRDAFIDFIRRKPRDPYLNHSRPMLRTRFLDCLARRLSQKDIVHESATSWWQAHRA